MTTFRQHVVADYIRHGRSLFNIAWWPVLTYRIGAWALTLPYPARYPVSALYMVMHYWVQLVSSTTIARDADIGANLFLPHSGNIIIHPGCSIGDNCTILHEVTLGGTGERASSPRLGNNVFVGPGAKLFGPITIGDGARIAGNSLVISDVPAGTVAIGVPARIVPAPSPYQMP